MFLIIIFRCVFSCSFCELYEFYWVVYCPFYCPFHCPFCPDKRPGSAGKTRSGGPGSGQEGRWMAVGDGGDRNDGELSEIARKRIEKYEGKSEEQQRTEAEILVRYAKTHISLMNSVSVAAEEQRQRALDEIEEAVDIVAAMPDQQSPTEAADEKLV